MGFKKQWSELILFTDTHYIFKLFRSIWITVTSRTSEAFFWLLLKIFLQIHIFLSSLKSIVYSHWITVTIRTGEAYFVRQDFTQNLMGRKIRNFHTSHVLKVGGEKWYTSITSSCSISNCFGVSSSLIWRPSKGRRLCMISRKILVIEKLVNFRTVGRLRVWGLFRIV